MNAATANTATMGAAAAGTTLAELRARLGGLAAGPRVRADGLPPVLPTGHAALDALLPGGGWPRGAVSELHPESIGIGELTLLLPALAHLTRAGQQVACVGAPLLPYPPALVQHGVVLARLLQVFTRGTQETLWAAEQALRCPGMGAVLAWAEGLDDRAVRRLQLAAEAGGGSCLLYRPVAELARPSPAAVRARLRAAGGDALEVQLTKVRGGHARALVLHPAAIAAA